MRMHEIVCMYVTLYVDCTCRLFYNKFSFLLSGPSFPLSEHELHCNTPLSRDVQSSINFHDFFSQFLAEIWPILTHFSVTYSP